MEHPGRRIDLTLPIVAGVAVFAGAAMVGLLQTPWFAVDYFAGGSSPGSRQATAWEVFSGQDVAIAITAAGGSILAFVGAVAGSQRAFAAAALLISLAMGLVAYRMIDLPLRPVEPFEDFEITVGRLWGAWATLGVGVLAIVANGAAGAMAAASGRD